MVNLIIGEVFCCGVECLFYIHGSRFFAKYTANTMDRKKPLGYLIANINYWFIVVLVNKPIMIT